MLVESIEAIRSLFSGEMVTYRGTHITVEDARLFSLPQAPPRIAVAGSGSKSVRLAAEQGDAFIGVDPDAELVDEYRDLAGATREPSARWCCPTTPTKARRAYALRSAFGVAGWKVMAELPNVANFDAAVQTVRPEDVEEAAGIGSDPDDHIQAIMEYVAAGYDDVAVVHVGDDQKGFFRFWRDELAPRLQKTTG